jgi:hypothetical protein
MRSQRILFAALAFSLLIHFLVAGNTDYFWAETAHEISFPIEARLARLDLPAPARVSPPVKARPAAQVKAEAVPDSLPAPPSAEPLLPVSESVASSPPLSEPISAPAVEPHAQLPEVTPAQSVAPEPASRTARRLPDLMTLRYGVQSGEDGFIIGRTTYSWKSQQGRYSLVSVTEATGVTALFVSGKIIQVSEGKVTKAGLQPELFWIQKGKNRQPPVRFEWLQKRLMLPEGGVELLPQTQDLNSFPFHLAMLVGESDADWSLPVTNGKKLREYHFHVVGSQLLDMEGKQVETLRLQGSRSGEGSLDVWLAPDRDWLPVRIQMLDQKGKVIVLILQDSGV